MNRMLNSITVDKIRELRFLKTTLLGTLAALIFAATCVAAPGTPVVTGIATNASGPGGFIFDGTSMWVTDAVQGLCKIVPGGTGKLSNCILPPTSNTTVHAVLGQPAYDPIGLFVYLPDMSITSRGIWRYHFNVNAGTFNNNVADPGVNIAPAVAPAVGLGPQQPVAVALGDDGSLYASMSANKNSSLVRITTPSAATQTAVVMAKSTLSGTPARGLAFVGTALWYGDTDGEVLVPAAATCAGKCSGTLNTQVGVPSPTSIAWDAVNSMVYVGTASGVFQHNRLTGQTVLYSKFWKSATASGLLTDVTAVGVDTTGNLYYADDPTGSQVAGAAAVYSVAVNSLPDGQGNLASPPTTLVPTILTTPPFANPALLYSSGLTGTTGILYMGAHAWAASTTGFCKVDSTLPAPSLTACAVLPLGFVPGSPAYDKATGQVYLADTTAASQGIVKLTFNPATETVGVATPVVSNTVLVAAAAGATSPTALAVGPDGQLYVAMVGTTEILRVTTPAGKTHKVTFIGTVFEGGSASLAFHNTDLFDVGTIGSSILYDATLCLGNCTQLFLAVNMVLPTAVTSDGTNVYFGDAQKVMMFDPLAQTYSIMADTGLVNGVATPFTGIRGLTSDGQGHIYVADSSHMWEILGTGPGSAPTVTSLAPFQAPESSTKAVTITGTNFAATGLVVSTCPAITPGGVTVVSPTQITATFTVNPVGPLGACNVTVNTANGASAASAGSSFTVLIGPPAITTITTTPATAPASGFRGRTIPVSIAGANMGSGAIDLIPGITITGSVVNAAGTLLTANFVISPTATLGPQNVTVTTPSGPSNILTFTIAAAPPVLTTIAPPQGVAGSTVTLNLTGTDLFGATVNPPTGFTPSGTPTVTATAINASFIVAATVAAGPQSITVTGPGGTSNALTFKIVPALTSIAAVSARAGATTAVTLSGTSLAGVTSVNAGVNIQVTGVVATAGTVTATFASALNAPLGAQSVTVTDVNGTS
ncbi:MAG TPA: hypothetical protein VKJ01_03440, partial [Candidatus Solibacter sp.]|nr:hypothetical protein [Candidatus Solibacter sp.]